ASVLEDRPLVVGADGGEVVRSASAGEEQREQRWEVEQAEHAQVFFFFSSRRRHTRSVSAFLLNRSSDLCLSTEGVYCSRCVYYGKHQSFQATAGFRDYAPNAYSSSNGWSVFYQ